MTQEGRLLDDSHPADPAAITVHSRPIPNAPAAKSVAQLPGSMYPTATANAGPAIASHPRHLLGTDGSRGLHASEAAIDAQRFFSECSLDEPS